MSDKSILERVGNTTIYKMKIYTIFGVLFVLYIYLVYNDKDHKR